MNKKTFLIFLILILLFSGCYRNDIVPKPNDELMDLDTRGYKSINTVFSDSVVGVRYIDVAVQFQYNVYNEDTEIGLINGATLIHDNSMAILSSGINSTAEVHINSIESLRYRPGHEGYTLFTSVWFDGCKVNSEQLAGIFNENEDGYYVGCINDTFVVGLYKGGTKEFISNDSFNGDLSCNYDITKLNIYRISFGWLGIAPIKYEVFCKNDWRTIHTIDKTNTQTMTTINNPVLPVQFHIKNFGNTQNISMGTASWNAGIINGGSEKAGRRDFSVQNSKSILANNKTNIITIKSNETFWGKTNRIDSALGYLTFATDGAKSVKFYVIRNANISGGTWSNVDTNNSIMLYNLNATYNSGSNEIVEHIFALQKVGDLNEIVRDLNIHIHNNETLSIVAFSTANNDIETGIRWEELY